MIPQPPIPAPLWNTVPPEAQIALTAILDSVHGRVLELEQRVRDLEARLLAYAEQQKPSEWIKAQPAFVGAQGKTVLDPDFDIDDGGLPHETPALPRS